MSEILIGVSACLPGERRLATSRETIRLAANCSRPPKLTDAELITLAVAQVLLGMSNDWQFLALARWRLAHLFPRLIDQSGHNRRLRALAPEIGRCINYLAFISPSFGDRLRLLDSTPVPCGQSRETMRRSEFAGYAGYGYCRTHHAGSGASGCT